jgi:transcriptional regulatory protein CAT8
VGFECKVSDRLTRRAFPRGYTETLEERVRELEAENKKLLALLDQKDEQMELFHKVEPLNTSNLNRLNQSTEYIDEGHIHSGPGCCANYPHSVHERPVSIAGSIDDEGSIYDGYDMNPRNVSFEQNQAPGLNAALAIARMNGGQKLQLANLVAMSIPRSTEETLFLPSLLSKIGEVHGFDSKACLSTASAIAALKEVPKVHKQSNVINFGSIDFKHITASESNLFFMNLKLPPRVQLDQLITVYFQEWGSLLPIVDKDDFLAQYSTFIRSMESKFIDQAMVHKERFGAILIIVIQLALFCQKNQGDTNEDLIQFYDFLIHQLINSNIASTCSIQSLQILSLALFYCLNIGDVVNSYTLRGRVITMAQQLRLHRCPSAVLGNNGSAVSKFQQSERRILFWCIYTLDTFASLQLGVPRLLKDYEIECALPMGNDNDDDDNVNILVVNNNKVSLVGKVCNLSLAMMRYAKVLGNIVDFIFKRHSKSSEGGLLHEQTLIHEGLLDSWRRELPNDLKFELDVNGMLRGDRNDSKVSLLVLLYYNAKLLIHLPIIASEVNGTRGSASYIVVQQCTMAMLNILSDFYSKKMYYIPVPMNITRTKTRLALLSAKGALEYTRGGALFQESKTIIQNVVTELKDENINEIPGNLSKRCVKLLESAVETIMGSKEQKKEPKKKKRPIAPNEDSLTQMLTQLESVPPIVPNHVNNNRVPHTHVDTPMDGMDTSMELIYPKVAPSITSDHSESTELEFAADGSLGLAPWLDFDLVNFDMNGYGMNNSNSYNPVKQEEDRKTTLFDWQNSM